MSLTIFACVLTCGLHATVDRTTARAILQRWRPTSVPLDAQVAWNSPYTRDYIRAVTSCQDDDTFAILQMQPSFAMYMVRRLDVSDGCTIARVVALLDVQGRHDNASVVTWYESVFNETLVL
jgi:hypothetical protein